MKYIAYGSNMSRSQMAVRCPGAVLIGTGYLHGAQLEFYLHATVQSTSDPTDIVPVAVWEINEDHEQALDFYEGYPYYYDKTYRTVQMLDGSEIEGMLYEMVLFESGAPTQAYLNGIHNAYMDMGFQNDTDILYDALRRSLDRARRPGKRGETHGKAH